MIFAVAEKPIMFIAYDKESFQPLLLKYLKEKKKPQDVEDFFFPFNQSKDN